MSWTPAIVGAATVGSFRIGAWFDYFRKAFNKLKKNTLFYNVSFDIQLRSLRLGDRDATTGWRDITYDESETVEMIIVNPANRNVMYTACGLMATYNTSGVTQDVLYLGDQVVTDEGWYSVVNTKVHLIGDSFFYREVELEYLTMEPF